MSTTCTSNPNRKSNPVQDVDTINHNPNTNAESKPNLPYQ